MAEAMHGQCVAATRRKPDAGGGAITMNSMGNGKPIFYCFACRVFFEGRKREHSSKQCHIDEYADYLAEKTAADNRQLAALCPRASAETTRTLRRRYTCNGCPRQFTSLTALMEHQILELVLHPEPERTYPADPPSELWL
eukprot:COSAG01_NODE_12630_length_1708_cov_43.511498_1_plen_140_part_00